MTDVEITRCLSPSEWELCVDGWRIASAKPTEPLRWDTRKHTDGEHAFTMAVRGNAPVQTISRTSVAVTIRNAK